MVNESLACNSCDKRAAGGDVKPAATTLDDAFASLTFERNRTPESQDLDTAFCQLATYRDGAIFLGHWAGRSEWEIHRMGDEIVMVIEGSTTLTLLIDGIEVPHVLRAGQLIVVPQSTWHRFETPEEVKVMTVTPQPTEHSVEMPL